ncbi:MAG: hypothetical protein K2X66_02530 [Cyanobacteria bacterium]|nr:hypothetical protein [Cyanobacteriota bacterium]
MKIDHKFFHLPSQSLGLIIVMTLLLNIIPLVAFAEMDSAHFGIYKLMFSLHGMNSPSAKYCGLTSLDEQAFSSIQKIATQAGASPSQMILLKNEYQDSVRKLGLFLADGIKSNNNNTCPSKTKAKLKLSLEKTIKDSAATLKKQ